MRHCPKHQHFQGLFLKGKKDVEDGPQSRWLKMTSNTEKVDKAHSLHID
jgi:hypothetical protein